MNRTIVTTEHAPQAIGPYSQAVCLGGFVFTAGQIPLDPATGELIASKDVGVQTRRVMDNLKAVLEASRSSFGQVVKATIYVIDLADFAAINDVYASYFPAAPPARSTVQVAALPRGAKVEIDMIANSAG
jgi:2-iminobutanoate/2-iminopropanoate deaminase